MSQVRVAPVVSAGYAPVPQTAGQEAVVTSILALNATALVATEILDMAILPAGCVPTDVDLHVDDLDSNGTPTITLDVGLLTGIPGDTVFANRVCGTEFGNNLTTAQASGIARNAVLAGKRIVAQDVDRSIGIKVEAAAATAVVRTGTLTRNVGLWKPGTVYAANDFLVLPNGVTLECTTGGTSGVYGKTETKPGTQVQPNWNIGFGLTTTDGSVTWTCRTPVVGLTLRYVMSRAGLPI